MIAIEELRRRAGDEADCSLMERGDWREVIVELCNEVARLRRGLMHIAETIQDPDAAQFAARLADGSAEPPKENT